MNARETLRHATSSLHEELDGRLATYDLTDRTQYAKFLRVQAAVLAPMEEELERAGVQALVPDWAERTRRGALKDDLQELGVRADRREPPRLTRAADMLGTLYVLEGSRLGATFILRRSGLGASGLPTRFLAHGAGRAFWPAFVALLEAHPASSTEQPALVAAAKGAFEAFLAAAANQMQDA